MKRAKKQARKFSVEISGPYVWLKGVMSANAAVKIKADPWRIFKPIRSLIFMPSNPSVTA